MQDTASMQPKLTPEDVQLLRQLNERDRQVLGGMPRPRAADGLRVLGYVAMYSQAQPCRSRAPAVMLRHPADILSSDAGTKPGAKGPGLCERLA
jgi:hypothetical protein